MRLIQLNEFDVSRESILFMNGGGQIPLSKHSKLVQYFNHYNYNAFAVELPGHGKSRFHEEMTQDKFLSHFKNEFTRIIKEKKIKTRALIGFSLGGLFALKAIEMKILDVNYVIGYGCGFGIGEAEKDTFNYYTSEKFFHDMNWGTIMKKNHGKGWYNPLLSMDNLMNVESPIFSDLSKMGNDTQILIILGENEELFTPNFTKEMVQKNQSHNIHLRVVPNTSHFEYTSKSWENFQQIGRAHV